MTGIDPFALRALLGEDAAPARRALSGEHGVALPPLTDHHVHLHLIDEDALAPHGIAAAVDLGGDPFALARRTHSFPRIAYAGAFLTSPGGYPVGRAWAPPEIVREVTDPSLHPGVPGGIATAVDEQAACGASVIKVALNARAGAVFDLETLTAIVAAARERGLPVVAHVEGEGMTRLALDAEVAVVAHAPFSERLDRPTISRAVAVGQRWISTLTIHEGAEREIAERNLATFVSAGGHVLYGTDLGNGERTGGIQVDELVALDTAGLRGPALIATLAAPWPASAPAHGVATFIPGDPPTSLDDIPTWLGGATVVAEEAVVHDES